MDTTNYYYLYLAFDHFYLSNASDAANISFFRVNLSHYLLKVTQKGPLCSVLDLKSQ
ncbi:hypothetical protein Oscil6304_0459 [Oscillatoria acuminata PCC 6304]|uniref:Uncharacterized protein n=1 Tax=Oscillatoria acuminata PCC 6304 TaxID=56110 RepID=K9TDJ8_9CYAN|nr:hypothetical protein Oscil6304_0459 [Oscillatoria acuminata PCC 6304]